jgi:pimeloyl-[acyl-carrier protein] methyl ester esterase
VSLHVHRAGSGPALVFLHGWSMEGGIFADAFARLSGRFLCMAPDLPGHGRTTGYAPTIEASVAMLDKMLAAEALEQVTLVGWSLGAAIAWRYLEACGAGRVSRMVSIDMSPAILNGDDWQLGLVGQDAAAVRAKAPWFATRWPRAAGYIAAGLFARPEGTPLLPAAEARARILDNDPTALAQFWTSLCDSDSRDFIARLPVPLLAIHGAQSRLYSMATGKWLAKAAPRASMLRFGNSGHSPHLEEPEAFAAALADFTTG